MNGWAIFGIVIVCCIVVAVAVGILGNLKDIKRYLRIRSM